MPALARGAILSVYGLFNPQIIADLRRLKIINYLLLAGYRVDSIGDCLREIVRSVLMRQDWGRGVVEGWLYCPWVDLVDRRRVGDREQECPRPFHSPLSWQ